MTADPQRWSPTGLVACLDVGSTWTKLAVVDVRAGTLVATDTHPTTLDTDVLDGVDTLLGRAGPVDTVYCCSSAGGGLRLAVVGYESLVSAEAGHRVALSAGARVVHLAAGPLSTAGVAALKAARPDVVLLVGGTDGGDTDVILHNAHRLGTARLRVPVVVAGNTDALDRAVAALTARGVPVTATTNVLPRIGVIDPGPARAAIRDVFLRHVIGGKRLSKGPRFARLVRAATPDAVFTAVELLADTLGRDLLVVDVGGATTDVYSALVPTDTTPRAGRPTRADVAGTLWRSRTVEGDLGVTWSADSTDAAAAQEKLSPPTWLLADEPEPDTGSSPPIAGSRGTSAARAGSRGTSATGARSSPRDVKVPGDGAGGVERSGGGRRGPGAGLPPRDHEVPGDGAGGAERSGGGRRGPGAGLASRDHEVAGFGDVGGDLVRAALAGTIAVRRHARTGRDLRDVRLVVASGGVFRHAAPPAARRALDVMLQDHGGGWALPEAPRVVVDAEYVLAPAGLLAVEHPQAAAALLRHHLLGHA